MSALTPIKSYHSLVDFVRYCNEHPGERFWQALRNWSGYNFVCAHEHLPLHGLDTFYWEGKRHDQGQARRGRDFDPEPNICSHKRIDYSVIGDTCLDCGARFQHHFHGE